MRKELTQRQREFYDFIVDRIREDGYPPTIREIMDAFGIASTNGVRTTLFALEKKGYIRRHPMRSRGIELTDYMEKLPAQGIRKIPIIGRVAAGEPVLAVQNIEGMLTVDESFVPAEDVFGLRVHGESMKNAGILDGDYVLARQQNAAEKGDIIVAIIGEDATVKRYVPDKGFVQLMPENEHYDPIIVSRHSENFRIAGKVIGLMRRL